MSLAEFVIAGEPVHHKTRRARRECMLALASRHEWGEAFAAGVASAMLLMPP
jgi:hypothetical protein